MRKSKKPSCEVRRKIATDEVIADKATIDKAIAALPASWSNPLMKQLLNALWLALQVIYTLSAA